MDRALGHFINVPHRSDGRFSYSPSLELLPYYVIRKRRAKNFSGRKKPLINTRPARDRKKERQTERQENICT